jgi:hypothetical protein
VGAGAWRCSVICGVTVLLAACGSDKSPTASLAETRQATAAQSAQLADFIDALFLGSGPLIPRDGITECPLPGVWSGYSRGSTLRVRLSSRVPASVAEGLREAVRPVSDATAGSLAVTVETTSEADPEPGANEVTVTEQALPRAAGCGSNAGCVEYRFAGRGLLMGARVVAPPGRSLGAYVHDVVGHAILGLCVVDARRIGGAENSLMSGGHGVGAGDGAPTLTGLDLEAIRAVFGSSLAPGASRSAFLAARLVNLQAGQLPKPR